MTGDEAFIRAVVDHPGDDTPRLAYADWLDDHDDPARAAYLRAEVAAVRTGRGAERRELAAGLDAVWVARVSRPPDGVCCELSVFRDAGPSLSDADLSRFESDVGLPITGDYRAFLLNTNGAVLADVASGLVRVGTEHPTHCFYSLGAGPLSDRRNLVCHTKRHRSLLPALLDVELWDAGPDDVPWQGDAIPIGDSGLDFTLFYAVRGKYAGRLHLHDYTGDWCRFGWNAGPHGPPTLPKYLHRLAANGYGLADTYPSQPLQEFWTR